MVVAATESPKTRSHAVTGRFEVTGTCGRVSPPACPGLVPYRVSCFVAIVDGTLPAERAKIQGRSGRQAAAFEHSISGGQFLSKYAYNGGAAGDGGLGPRPSEFPAVCSPCGSSRPPKCVTLPKDLCPKVQALLDPLNTAPGGRWYEVVHWQVLVRSRVGSFACAPARRRHDDFGLRDEEVPAPTTPAPPPAPTPPPAPEPEPEPEPTGPATPENLRVTATTTTSITWTWDAVEGAIGYQGQFSEDATFTAPPDDPTFIILAPATSHTVPTCRATRPVTSGSSPEWALRSPT